jgi:nitrogen regulatory protein PII
MKQRMIVSIVPRYDGEKIANAAVQGGATGGTVILGKGTAPNAILQFLGIGETAKDIVLSITDNENANRVKTSVIEATKNDNHTGITFMLDVCRIIRSGATQTQKTNEDAMDKTSGTKLICVIVNDGYAEDAMAAARSQGAKGGTIIKARGTAKENDAKFFGVHLTPEKEMLLIVVEEANYEGVFKAIQEMPCFEKKGSGVAFAIPTSDFTMLGIK